MKSLRTLLTALLATFLLSTCEQSEPPNPENQKGLVEVVLLTESKHLQGLVHELELSSPPHARYSSSLLDAVDFDRAVKSINPETGNTHYSFSMTDDNGFILRKFILTENQVNEVVGSVFEYEMDAEWYAEYDSFPGMDKYTGYFRILDLEGNVIAKNKMVNGTSEAKESTSGRTSGMTCSSRIVQIGQICVGGYCSPKYETVTTCYFTTSSGGGGSSGSPTLGDSYTEPRPEYVVFEFDDSEPMGTAPSTASNSWRLAQTFGKLCDNIIFKYSANSFKAEISGLGGTYHNYVTNKILNIELGVNCVDIPEYYIGTSHQAATGFANIFNSARTKVEQELESGLLAPNVTAMRNRLIAIITSGLQSKYSGATFGLGECQGNVAKNVADYGC
ncbi:hypothetical protein [Marinoscillum furvescens]|uniref:Lipoprotein n=1 Tax=Marinoscillum furvescens DSM 4134 TaxID=1122208 RepID=A0A3D9L746_MARFU|nr:hypothetical protein [Marinoscillum furvescens]REE01304.1 hypothetical protein C7460_104327 [Marinoscillum furvescens DSM 4134]